MIVNLLLLALKVLPISVLQVFTIKTEIKSYDRLKDILLFLILYQSIILLIQLSLMKFILFYFNIKLSFEDYFVILYNFVLLTSHYLVKIYIGEYKLTKMYLYTIFKIITTYTFFVDECIICYNNRLILKDERNTKYISSCDQCKVNICLYCSIFYFYDKNTCPGCRKEMLLISNEE